MCNQFTLHHEFRIDTGRTKFEQQTDSIFLPADPADKEHKDLSATDLGAPRRAHYMHKAWKKHQNTVHWVDGFKFNQTRSNAIIFYDTLPAHCTPKVVVMKSEEIIYQKVYVSPQPPPKIPGKIIGCVIWILMSQEAARTPNESTQNPKPNCQVRGDPYVDKNPQSVACCDTYTC